jgi:hypothetical protein
MLFRMVVERNLWSSMTLVAKVPFPCFTIRSVRYSLNSIQEESVCTVLLWPSATMSMLAKGRPIELGIIGGRIAAFLIPNTTDISMLSTYSSTQPIFVFWQGLIRAYTGSPIVDVVKVTESLRFWVEQAGSTAIFMPVMWAVAEATSRVGRARDVGDSKAIGG